MHNKAIVLEVKVRKNTKYYVAVSDDLDLAGQGETIEAAIAKLEDAIEFFFEVADKDDMAKHMPRLLAKAATNYAEPAQVKIASGFEANSVVGQLELAYA